MSLDEEYVRQVFAIQQDAAQHPAAKKLLEDETIIRSFENSKGLTAKLVRGMETKWLPTRSGLLQPVKVFPYDGQRVNRVLTKITKGLFYFFGQRPLPIEARVVPVHLQDAEDFNAAWNKLDDFPFKVGPHAIGDNVVVFKGTVGPPPSMVSMWVVLFYEALAFQLNTVRPDQYEELMRAANEREGGQ